MNELQRKRQKQIRDDTKVIENILHPNPIIKGIEICHEHTRNGKIRFSAWQGDNPVRNGKQFSVNRHDVLTRKDFYLLYTKDLEWLANP